MTMNSVEQKQPTILIVDDNPKNLEVLGKLLQVEKYKIEFAVNGKAALEWLEIRQFDLILLDINMPGLNGFEVCKIIRSNPLLGNVPIIFISAESDRENILKGFELGAQDYVTKPFDSRELIMRVKTHLLLKKSIEELEELNTSLEEKVKERTLQLNKAKERAEASDRLKTAFMDNISHEVRTPLNGILGFASLIVKPNITDEKKKHFLEILEQSSKRLLNTITGYMDISLIVSGNQVVNKATCLVTYLLKAVFQKYKPLCETKGIVLTFDIPPSVDDFQIKTDETLLLKILNHLMDNALKFTNEGRIVIGFTLKENKVEFFIKDTGKGISTEAQQHIYNYFIQEDMTLTRNFEGSGLGLSISKGLVKLLEGEIWFETEKGKGSIFYFTIPFAESTNKLQNNTVVENEYKAQSKPVILIAEDDDTNYSLLNEIFSSPTIELIRAVNGAEAVEICRNNSTITLILMDLKMPVLNGFEATKQIKAMNKNIPIVATTAYAYREDEAMAQAAGCDDYIAKPFNQKKLEAIINKYLVGTKLQLVY
ncbi:MAG: response regulator [Salinivirgaceae bacterium]